MSVSPKTQEEIQSWIQEKVADHLGVEAGEVDVNQEFMTFDVDSIVAFSLAGEIVQWTGMELSPTLVWEYPTISDLSVYLSHEMQQRSQPGK